MAKFKNCFNSTVGEGDEIKSFLYTSDGTALTQSGGALDVNIVSSDISISVAESDVYAEDSAHVSGDDGAFMLAVRRDARAAGSDADGDYSSLNVNASGELWTKDADVLTQLQSGVTISDGGNSITVDGTVVISDGGSDLPSYDLVVGPAETYTTLDAAISAASDGQVILVRNGSYLLNSAVSIDKQLTIFGESQTGVIFETAGTTADPVTMFNVTANNVKIAQMTLKHKKSSNTSIESAIVASGSGFPQTRISNFLLASCVIEYAEMAVVVRCDGWTVRDCTFTYATGTVSNSNRAIVMYGNKGNGFIKDNLLKNDVLNGTSFRPFYLTSTTGSNPNETVEGKLVIEGTTHVGLLSQFFNQDNSQSVGAGTFELQIKNNVIEESNLFAGFYSSIENAGDMFSSITLANNSISNLHAVDGGKGMYGVAGTAAFRSSALVLHATGNVFGQTTYRSGWVSVDTELIGRETAIPVFSVAKDSSIPDSGTATSINLGTSGNSITVDAVDLDIRDLSAASDSVSISDGTDSLEVNADGSINVVASQALDTTIVSAQPTVGTSAAVLVATVSNQKTITVRNSGDEPIYVGPAGVSVSTGFQIGCGEVYIFEVNADLYAIAAAATAAGDLHTLQIAA